MNQLKNLINQFTQFGAKKGGSPNVSAGKGLPLGNGSGSRPMKFPYTFTAKLVQFPWMYYIKNNWLYKNYVIAIFVSLLAFVKIQNIVHPGYNKQKWEEVKRKEREEQHEH